MSDQVRVQFGCGGNILPDFINHDAEVDISKPLPYADNSVDFVMAEHVFEHVGTHDGLRFLDEVCRILKKGGTLRLCVPVLTDINEPADIRDLILGHGHLQVLSFETVTKMLKAAGFECSRATGRSLLDGHWRVIGVLKDDRETLRMEAIK